MNTQEFKITKNGLFNYETGTFLSFDKFTTKKGEWSKKLLKALGKMDNADLNRFNKVYSKVYGVEPDIVGDEFVKLIPNFRTQNVNVYADGKFYKARTFKRSNYVKVGDNEFRKESLNDLLQTSSGDYVNINQETNKLIEELKQLNLGTKLEVAVDLNGFQSKENLSTLEE